MIRFLYLDYSNKIIHTTTFISGKKGEQKVHLKPEEEFTFYLREGRQLSDQGYIEVGDININKIKSRGGNTQVSYKII